MEKDVQSIGQQADSLIRSVLDYRLLQVAGRDVYVHSLFVFLIILLATYVASHLIQRNIGRLLARTGVREEGSLAVFRRLAHYGIIAIGLTTGLATLGFDLAALFAASALFAVAIGFAMQNIAQNFVSGIILLVERSIKPFDILELNGRVVKVISMGIRSTIVRTLDDEDLIVPNSDLVQSVVTNFTLRDSVHRLRAGVGVAYDSDLRRVQEALLRAATDLPWRCQDHEPRVQLTAFGSSSVDFEVSVWILQPWDRSPRKSDLFLAIWWALKDADIVIAFPQVDVHFDPGSAPALLEATTQRALPAASPSLPTPRATPSQPATLVEAADKDDDG